MLLITVLNNNRLILVHSYLKYSQIYLIPTTFNSLAFFAVFKWQNQVLHHWMTLNNIKSLHIFHKPNVQSRHCFNLNPRSLFCFVNAASARGPHFSDAARSLNLFGLNFCWRRLDAAVKSCRGLYIDIVNRPDIFSYLFVPVCCCRLLTGIQIKCRSWMYFSVVHAIDTTVIYFKGRYLNVRLCRFWVLTFMKQDFSTGLCFAANFEFSIHDRDETLQEGKKMTSTF